MPNIQQYFDLRFAVRSLPVFIDGLVTTFLISAVSMVGAVALGLILLLPRVSSWRAVWVPVVAYVEVMRNTPLILQIYLLYFALPMFGLRFSAFVCAAIAISAQHAAFLVEIFRAGLLSVSARQVEAAKALGMRRFRMLKLVVLPQALLNVIAPTNNQLIVLIKDTSLVSAIGVLDLTLTGKVLLDRTAAPFEIFVVIGLLYLLITTTVGVTVRAVEMIYRARVG